MDLSAPRRRLATFVLTPVLIAAAVWAELSLQGAAPGRPIFFLLAPVVAALATLGGPAPGLLGVLLTGGAVDYFVLAPGDLLSFGSPAETAALSAFITISIVLTIVAGRFHRAIRTNEQRRASAEAVAERAEIVEQITAALARSVQPADAIHACLQESAHWLRARGGAVFLVSADAQALTLARAIGYSDALEAKIARVSIRDGGPLADAVTRRAAVYLESRERYRAEYPQAEDLLDSDEHEALVAFPLIGSTGVLAVVRLDFPAPRVFADADKDVLAQLAPRAAQALERTRQHEWAQRARAEAELHRQRADQEIQERFNIEQALRASENRYRSLAARTTRLHALTAALSESVAVNAVARAVVERGRAAVGATAADVVLLSADATIFETVYADPRDTIGARMPVEEGLCATEALVTRTPLFIGSFEEMQDRCWRSAATAADGGYASSAALPLLVEGTAIGVLSFHFTVPVNFDDEYKALLVSVAQHCAQAIDRARLYESAQRARAEAEQANRLKDDFLSIVSHELRTPLSSILGWTSILQRPAIEPAVASRAVQSIRDNATRQAKLVDDLLDFSRIVAGRLVLDRQRLNLRDLLRGVIETVLPVAAAQRIDLSYQDTCNATMEGDTRRLEQVFLNLLGNAVKFTPPGGRITIGVSSAGDAVRVHVSDTGVGIDPAFLPHVFERFRQGEPSASREHDGVGLGLSIAKQLVEAHGGTIEVSSEGRGRGTTFVVTLPAAVIPDTQGTAVRFEQV